MTAAELERRAAAELSMPEHLTAPEGLLYLSLRRIYHDWHTGLLPKPEAKREKQQVLAQYERYAAALEETQHLCRIFVDVTKDTEALRRAYHLAKHKGAAPDELLGLACQIIRTATGDKTF